MSNPDRLTEPEYSPQHGLFFTTRERRAVGAVIASAVVTFPFVFSPGVGATNDQEFGAALSTLHSFKSPTSACGEATLATPETKAPDILDVQMADRWGAAAIRCLDLYDNAEVALVDYADTPVAAEELATLMKAK